MEAPAPPISCMPAPPRKPRPFTDTVAPFSVSVFEVSKASTPPVEPFQASAVGGVAALNEAVVYCGTRMTW